MKYENYKILDMHHYKIMVVGLLATTASLILTGWFYFQIQKDNAILISDLKFAIAKHNNTNHDLISANERIQELSVANGTLIEFCGEKR